MSLFDSFVVRPQAASSGSPTPIYTALTNIALAALASFSIVGAAAYAVYLVF